MPSIVVRTPAELLDRWTGMTLVRSLEDVAWSIELTTYDRWSPLDRPPAVDEFDEISVTLNDELAFFGHVFTTNNAYDARSHTFTISGRSRSAAIVDCSTAPKTWKGKTLKSIATEVLEPFGLALIIEPSAESLVRGTFGRIATENGERVYDFLIRLAKYRAVLLTTDTVGNVVITTAERRPLDGVTLRRGEGRILSAGLKRDGAKRFSSYTTRAQIPAPGIKGTDPITLSATVKDPGVPLHRPLVLMPDGHETRAGLRTRAQWERSVRLARAISANYTVAGWEAKPGRLWAPNDLVAVRDDVLGLNTDMLVVECTFELSGSTETTSLRLADPDAYIATREPAPRKPARVRGISSLPNNLP